MNILGITGQAGSGKDTVAEHLVENHQYTQLALADPIKRFGYFVFNFDKLQLWGPSTTRNAFDPRYARCDLRSKGINLSDQTSLSVIQKSCDPAWAAAAEQLLEYGPTWLQEVTPDTDPVVAMDALTFWFVSLGHKFPELSPRIMLQSLGTAFGREEIHEDIWIDALLKTARKLLSEEKLSYSRLEGLSWDEKHVTPAGVVVSDIRFHNELRAIKSAAGKVIRVLRTETDSKAETVGIKGHASEAQQKEFEVEQFDAILSNNRTIDDLLETVDTLVLGLGGH